MNLQGDLGALVWKPQENLGFFTYIINKILENIENKTSYRVSLEC